MQILSRKREKGAPAEKVSLGICLILAQMPEGPAKYEKNKQLKKAN